MRGPRAFRSAPGTILNRSPTRPMSATWKIGASSSLLMATMRLAVLHAGEMLDRAGDADRDIDFGRDDLAGLADLIIVGRHSPRRPRRGWRRRRRRACRRAARCIAWKCSLRAERAAARDDDLGAGQLRPLGLARSRRRRSLKGPGRPCRRPARPYAEPPSRAAFSKAVPRTVITFFASDDLTVAIALPA